MPTTGQIEVWRRSATDAWEREIRNGGAVELSSVRCRLMVDELYERAG